MTPTDRDCVSGRDQELRRLYELGQPSPDMRMDDGSPHFTNEALVARMEGQRAAFHAIPELLARVEGLVVRVAEAEKERDEAVKHGSFLGVAEVRAARDRAEARVAVLEAALEQIAGFPSGHDLLFNAVVKAMHTVARAALADSRKDVGSHAEGLTTPHAGEEEE